ncbi:response regulator transcription factor [Intestinimonas butyriciproducens]|uniref:Stage 0 sporulation protein A homolog n=1 Tax=Intestinimonas butyriciproducens TaxID=1297617 RepID=A0A0S2W4N1_9FIRM|nr:response regulator transcription factor [Intestinimonas butyriciproducens]SCI61474.1 Transcriptional regulatory protein YycF [uncultured Clostridium sp.]ALP94243.1 Phosphate regulon transcriptional regulatory protein PhoB (SphR) [Intestinimonas butyriciproducens]MBU5229627.1 response regulator transcription factor [Intestinimonas butyriciproducens]MCI6363244.1 response regulator transcription factor [Intestinimonas butyriciproducens]MCR1906091.1 response regulator transcription factor [Inte
MDGNILLVDDDVSILLLVSDVLEENGMNVVTARSGEEAVRLMEGQSFDLILLDIMMKGLSGLDVCRKIRSRVSCPILFLSAKDSVKDIVAGLDLGADDYLTKPFVLEELVARIQAHLRRQMRSDPRRASAGPIQIGGIRMEPEEMRVTRNGVEVPLSTREFELLAYLMQNAGQTLSRERIFHDVWRTEYGDVGTVAINIKNLRAKLDPDWRYIKTVWGSGYRFVTQNGFVEEESDDRRS